MRERGLWSKGQDAFERLRARHTDPLAGLADVHLLRSLLLEEERDLVGAARAQARSWADIGAALGTSRQGAWRRLHDLDPTEKGA